MYIPSNLIICKTTPNPVIKPLHTNIMPGHYHDFIPPPQTFRFTHTQMSEATLESLRRAARPLLGSLSALIIQMRPAQADRRPFPWLPMLGCES